VTRPDPPATLDAFYRRVRPAGPGWGPVAARNPDVVAEEPLGRLFASWVVGIALVYATLLGTGWLIVGETTRGVVALVVAGISAVMLWRLTGTLARPAGTGERQAMAAD